MNPLSQHQSWWSNRNSPSPKIQLCSSFVLDWSVASRLGTLRAVSSGLQLPLPGSSSARGVPCSGTAGASHCGLSMHMAKESYRTVKIHELGTASSVSRPVLELLAFLVQLNSCCEE